ncbi:MAG TPA: phage tail tube protein [Phycisphaerae bacterium]|nr:phage tail tube protein [Phycisphaerae bacterium]
MPEQLFILGKDAKLYFGATGADLADLTELDNVKDVTLTLEAGEADVTTRANSGWRATAATLRQCTAEFQMVWKPGDAGFDAVQAAFLSNGTLELAILDQDRGVAGAQGPKGSFSITSFSRSEALEEAIVVNVSAKLAAFDEWVEVAGT